MPSADRCALVLARDTDAAEPVLLVAADRPLVVGRGVDDQTVVAAVVNEVARDRADGGVELLVVLD